MVRELNGTVSAACSFFLFFFSALLSLLRAMMMLVHDETHVGYTVHETTLSQWQHMVKHFSRES